MARAPAISTVASNLNKNPVKGPGMCNSSSVNFSKQVTPLTYLYLPVKGKTPVLSLSARMSLLEEQLTQLEIVCQWWKEWKEGRRARTTELGTPSNQTTESVLCGINQGVLVSFPL